MKKYLVITATLLLFWSCNSYTYIPSEHNIMPFEEKGDAVIGASSGLINVGLKAGYAITDNVGVISTLNSFDLIQSKNDYTFFNDYSWDNEVVFYKKFSPNLYYGANLGLGWGKLNNFDEYYHINTNKQYVLPWINGLINHNTGNSYYGFWGVSLKASRLDYSLKNKIALNSNYDNMMFNEYFDVNKLNRDKYTLEAGVTFGYNFNFVKIQYQGVAVIAPPDDDYIFPFNTTFSIVFNLGYFFRDKKTRNNL